MIVVPKNAAENVLMAQWACDILDTRLEMFGFDRYGQPMFQTMGFSRNGEMACVWIAYQYSRPNIFVAFAANNPRWASKENIRAIGVWLFKDLGCSRVTTLTQKKNRRSRKFQEGIGCKPEGNLRKASDEGDIIVYGITRHDHEKWLRKAFNGQKIRTRSSRSDAGRTSGCRI